MFERPDKETARAQVAALVGRYEADRRTPTLSEAQTRLDYIDPLLRIFGWDVGNAEGLPFGRQEVVVEESVELPNEDDPTAVPRAGNPDYTLRPNGQRLMFVEAKKPAVDVATALAPAYQTRRYGWSAAMPVAILTNFDRLIVYDCREQPHPTDDAATARWPGHNYSAAEYISRFDELWQFLSHEQVQHGAFYAHFDVDQEVRGEASFDAVFLSQVRRWRTLIATDVATRHPRLTAAAVGRVTQRLLNRLLFLRICEDRNLERYGELLDIGDTTGLKARFLAADRRYNAGLFKAIDDADVEFDLVKQVVEQLYYPRSPYAFAVVEPSVLAAVYEQFLAERIELDDERHVTLKRKPETVHAGGVVATPAYIVDEILARVLDPKQPR